jgi:hypothetical protein
LAHNIVVVCSGSHEKKVNLGEVFWEGVLVLAVELMEVFEKLWQPAVVVDEHGMVVV